MFLRNLITTSTENCSEQLDRLKTEIENADAIVIGAGAGMSAAAGFSYSGERFEKYFSDFHKKYGFSDMYSGGFYPYETLEEYWAWWSRHIWINRYAVTAGKPYTDLLNSIKDKDYFVLTTNVDHSFSLRALIKSGCFIHRAITVCGNAPKPVTIKPMIMRKPCAKWYRNKRI